MPVALDVAFATGVVETTVVRLVVLAALLPRMAVQDEKTPLVQPSVSGFLSHFGAFDHYND